jgi:hypothetical protein
MLNTLKSLYYFLPKYKIENKLISLELDLKNNTLKKEEKDLILKNYLVSILSKIDSIELKNKWINQFDNKEHILFSLISLKYWNSIEIMMQYFPNQYKNLENKSGENLFFTLSNASLEFDDLSEGFLYKIISNPSSLKLNDKQVLQFYKAAINTNNHIIMDALLSNKFKLVDKKTQASMVQEIFKSNLTNANVNILTTWMNYFYLEKDKDGNNILQHVLKLFINYPYKAEFYSSIFRLILNHVKHKENQEQLVFLENKNNDQQNLIELMYSLKLNDEETYYYNQNYTHFHEQIRVDYERALFSIKFNSSIDKKVPKKIKI